MKNFLLFLAAKKEKALDDDVLLHISYWIHKKSDYPPPFLNPTDHSYWDTDQ